MLVRFNKGPWHRKLRECNPSELRNGVVQVAVYDRKARGAVYDTSPTTRLMVAPGHKIATYVVKMVTIDLHNGAGPVSIPSVYPDGAICFEYTGSH